MDLIAAALATLAILATGWLLLVAFLWLHRPSRALAGPALRLIPDLVRLIRALLADRTTPRSVRLGLLCLLAYLLNPVDVIPDFVPVVGAADDLIIAAAVLRWAGRRTGVEDLQAKWTGDPAGFEVLRRLLGM